jgi:hypothetical protein
MKETKFKTLINLSLLLVLLLINYSNASMIDSITDNSNHIKSKIVPTNLYLQTSMRLLSSTEKIKQEATPEAEAAAPESTDAEAPAEAPAEESAEAAEGEATTEEAASAEGADEGKISQEELEKSNERIDQLEDTLAEQQETVEQVRELLDDVSELSEQISNTKSSNEEIKQSVDEIKDYFQDLDFKIQAQSVETSFKLTQINNKLAKQLTTQLSLHLYSLNNAINNILDDLKQLNRKISHIKAVIPDTSTTCSKHTDCSACTEDSGCGWCAMTQSCIPGTADGALDGSCSFWEYSKCAAPECSALKTCSDCIKDAACGWCGDSNEPVCMKKEDGEEDCNEDKFVHLWKTINVCPTLKENNKIARLLKLVNKAEGNLVLTDPEDIRKKREELNVYSIEKSKKENDLKDLMAAVEMIKKQMEELEEEEKEEDIDDEVIEDNKESNNDFII